MPKMVLDLRGLSCPQPVFETKRAIENTSFEELEVTSVQNRFSGATPKRYN